MHDESLEPRAYAKLHADRYLWQEQQERAACQRARLDDLECVPLIERDEVYDIAATVLLTGWAALLVAIIIVTIASH